MRIEQVVDRVVARFIGTKHERDIKRLAPKIAAINELSADYERLSEAEITAKGKKYGPDFKQRLSGAVEPALVPAVALVREAGRRTLAMRHFDVQLIGGVVLHEVKIAEMKTGEGKTLVATLPAYLNALAGRGVHIVTVNDYLARRDAEWMGPL